MALTDWGRRCALVIQSGQVTDNEVNFPLLVTEDTLPSEIFDADGSYPALNGGGDIRFSSDSAGNTQLACEIESFITDNDPANGKAAVWVKVPSLSSSSNTTIYIWYNKAGESQPAEDNAYGKENVWDSGFVMVQHMNQIPGGTADEIVDSTSNDNDGTTSGMDSADQVSGQIDGSLDFDGVDDYVQMGAIGNLGSTGSISFWINETSTNSYAYLFDARSDSGTGFMYWKNSDNSLYTGASGGTIYVDSVVSSTLVENDWHFVAVSGITMNIAGDIKFGSRHDLLAGQFHKGIIDEVRISNVARTAGWIATEYNNQYAPGTFLIEGTPQSPGVGVPIAVFMHHYNQMRAA